MIFLTVGLQKGSQITRFREEAEKLGHTVEGCKSGDLVLKTDEGVFEAMVNGKKLADYDLIYLCAGIESKMRYEWYVASQYLLNSTHTKIVNEQAASSDYYPVQSWFYLKNYLNGIKEPKTYVAYGSEKLDSISEDLGFPMIIKLSETHQGKGIFLAHSVEEAVKVLEDNPGKTYVFRKFIANDGDIRVIVIGGKALGAMKRTPQGEDFRSNISAGGIGSLYDLENHPDIKDLAEKSAKISGIEIAGVDIILDKATGEPFVLEVNTGPQFKGFEKYTGINAAAKIIEYFIQKTK